MPSRCRSGASSYFDPMSTLQRNRHATSQLSPKGHSRGRSLNVRVSISKATGWSGRRQNTGPFFFFFPPQEASLNRGRLEAPRGTKGSECQLGGTEKAYLVMTNGCQMLVEFSRLVLSKGRSQNTRWSLPAWRASKHRRFARLFLARSLARSPLVFRKLPTRHPEATSVPTEARVL